MVYLGKTTIGLLLLAGVLCRPNVALAAPPFEGLPAGSLEPGAKWVVTETSGSSRWEAIWTVKPDGQNFSATWTHFPGGDKGTVDNIGPVRGVQNNVITIGRPGLGDYTGTIDPVSDKIAGSQSWAPGTWTVLLPSASKPADPAPTAAPATGQCVWRVHYSELGIPYEWTWTQRGSIDAYDGSRRNLKTGQSTTHLVQRVEKRADRSVVFSPAGLLGSYRGTLAPDGLTAKGYADWGAGEWTAEISAGCGLAAPSAEPSTTSVQPLPVQGIVGRITEWTGGSPTSSPYERSLAGARVLVVLNYTDLKSFSETDTLYASPIVADVVTSADGTFTANVPSGDYTIVVWKQFYVPTVNSISAPARFTGSLGKPSNSSVGHAQLVYGKSQGTATPVSTAPEQGVTGRITEWVGGSPTTSPTQRGVAARVVLVKGFQDLTIGSQTDVLLCGSVAADVVPNDQGTFVANVPAGSYTAVVWKQGYEPHIVALAAPGLFNDTIGRATLRPTQHQQLIINSTPAPNQPTANPSSPRWISSKSATHFFEPSGDEWLEYDNGRAIFRFVLKNSTPEFMELYDAVRRVTVRLFPDHYEWSDNLRTWNREDRGSWR
jgi:hypothetical protein